MFLTVLLRNNNSSDKLGSEYLMVDVSVLLVGFIIVGRGWGILCRVGRRVGDGLEVWRRCCGGDMELAGRGDEGEQKVIRR